MSRPLIGVTTPRRAGAAPFVLLRHVLRRAGARVRRLAPGASPSLEGVDALVLSGGEDISPALYGRGLTGEPAAASTRDLLESSLLVAAEARGLPLLGICRGAQMLNVAAGGTLLAEVGPRRPPAWPRRQWSPRLEVEVWPDSRLACVLGVRRLGVNCLHHQAVDRLGRGLRVVARDEFGLVQAIEGADRRRFVLGVQWHPELLPSSRLQRRLFRALVAAAASPPTPTPTPSLFAPRMTLRREPMHANDPNQPKRQPDPTPPDPPREAPPREDPGSPQPIRLPGKQTEVEPPNPPPQPDRDAPSAVRPMVAS